MHSDFNFEWVIDEIRETLKDELDFLKEGKNGEQCAQDLQHLNYIYVPKIFWNLCSEVCYFKCSILDILLFRYIQSFKGTCFFRHSFVNKCGLIK